MADTILAPVDQSLAGSATMLILDQGPVDFQFAPKVMSESNSSVWQEGEPMLAAEPVRIFRGNTGRRMNVEWEYIATSRKYTGTYIAQILRGIKVYFFKSKLTPYPVVTFTYPNVVPVATFFRLRDINIAYGPELVLQGGPFPLYTKVSATLELATGGIAPGSSVTKINVPPVNRPIDPKWY